MDPWGPELRTALTAMGIDVDNTTRVVIDIKGGQWPIVHIEQVASKKTIDVVRALSGVEIKITDRKE